jgi:hypothetical protein
MKTDNIDSSKVLVGLGAYMVELDSFRPPFMWGISPLSFTGSLELLFKQRAKSYFIKKNSAVNQEIKKEIHNYRYDTKVDSEEMKVPFMLILTVVFVTLAITLGITSIYSLSIIQMSLIVFIVGFPLIYLCFSYIIPKRRSVVGETHDEELKRSVQSLIDFGVLFCTENNLNPDMFPIKLQHNDYDGLIYEKKGQNNYVGYLKNETK